MRRDLPSGIRTVFLAIAEGLSPSTPSEKKGKKAAAPASKASDVEIQVEVI